MKYVIPGCALLLAMATAAMTADPAVDQLFQQARRKIVDNANRVPRYTCVETVDRTQYPPAPASKGASCQALIAAHRKPSPGYAFWRDRLRLDVAVMNGTEMFSWAGAGKFETEDIAKLTAGGASGSGAFIGFLSSVFGNDTDRIVYRGLEDDLATFDYNVPLEKSHYQYHTNGPDNTIAYSGMFQLDPQDGELQRLVVDTAEFPPGEQTCRVETAMDYHEVKMGNGNFLLPEVSTMDVIYRNGTESLNETRYSDCREYVGESTIHFEDVDPNAGSAAAAAAMQPLPPKVRLRIGLAKAIDALTAAAGDEITGVLLQEVKDKKAGVLAHAGGQVHGRILRLEQSVVPAPHWLVEIRFDTIERNGVRQPVNLRPLDDGNRPGSNSEAIGMMPSRGMGRMGRGVPAQQTIPVPDRAAGAGIFIFPERETLVLDKAFHSDWESR